MTPAPASARKSHSPANGAAGADGSPDGAAAAGDREGSGAGPPGGESVAVTGSEGAGRTLGPQERVGSRSAAAARARVFPDAHLPRQRISSVRVPANRRLLRGEPSPIPPCRPLARERSRISGKYNRRPGVTFRTPP